MKKFISILLPVLLLCPMFAVSADDGLRDNSLQIDNGRLERGENEKYGFQSELIQSLFSESDQEKLHQAIDAQDKQLAQEKGQLFSATQTKLDVNTADELFDPNIEQITKRDPNLGKAAAVVTGDYMPTLFYMTAVVIIVSIAAFISYRIHQGEEEREV